MTTGTETRATPTRRQTELMLSQLDDLPSLPTVATRLLALTTSEDSSTTDVAVVLESDAALTSAVLRMVRRADLGIGNEGLDVRRAIGLLGFRTIRNIALAVQVYDTLGNATADKSADGVRRGMWEHNLAAACVCEMLAHLYGDSRIAGEAFVCGLLHDIGKVALEACMPKSYSRVLDLVNRRHLCISDAESQVFGLDHTVAGKRLLSRWGLPSSAVACAWLHHQEPTTLPAAVVHRELVQLVYLADTIVRREGIGFSGYGLIEDPSAFCAQLGIDEASIDEVIEKLPSRMQPFAAMLELDDAADEQTVVQSLKRANAELGRSNATLSKQNRELQVHEHCLGVVRSFLSEVGDEGHLADVCKVAARSVVQLPNVEHVVAFLVDHDTGCFHIGADETTDGHTASSTIEMAKSEYRIAHVIVSVASISGLVLAPDGCETIWILATGKPPDKPLWMLTLDPTDRLTGAILLEADEPVFVQLRATPDAYLALSTAVATTAALAKSREDQERAAEDFADVNRRAGIQRDESVRAQTVSMIAEMAAGAAHELHNPLAVISGRSQIELDCCEDEALKKSLTAIIEQAERASQIVMDLMAFAKPPTPQPIEQRVVDVLTKLSQHWGDGSSLHPEQLSVSVSDHQVSVCADPGQLSDILHALMANAVEACDPQTMQVQINSSSTVSDETVRIDIVDNGVGMTAKVLERAVAPFFSNRAAGRGRGLGLSRAYRLVAHNGGKLWLTSKPNVGTTVTVELPTHLPRA